MTNLSLDESDMVVEAGEVVRPDPCDSCLFQPRLTYENARTNGVKAKVNIQKYPLKRKG